MVYGFINQPNRTLKTAAQRVFPHLGIVTKGALGKNDALHAVGQEARPWRSGTRCWVNPGHGKNIGKMENPGTQWRCLGTSLKKRWIKCGIF